jgi:hypothetical protein
LLIAARISPPAVDVADQQRFYRLAAHRHRNELPYLLLRHDILLPKAAAPILSGLCPGGYNGNPEV